MLRSSSLRRRRLASVCAVGLLASAGVSWAFDAAGCVRAGAARAESVALGLTFTELRCGAAPLSPRWAVIAGIEKEQKRADALLARVERLGLSAVPVSTRAGYEIRIERLTDAAAAEEAARRLAADGIAAETREIVHDAASPGGPFVAQILEVDPELVEIDVAHAKDAAMGLETTRELAHRSGATAAINGGFFRVAGSLAGESEGILIARYRLLSEPDRGRAGFAFSRDDIGGRSVFDRLRFCGELRFPGGAVLAIDGINRERRAGETILFTPQFHLTTLTPPGGIEIVQDEHGVRRIGRETGSSRIPESGAVISLAPGVALPEELIPGQRVELEVKLDPERPDPELLWLRARGALGAGPLLLQDGARVLRPEIEAISRVFTEARHPRTAVAARADGTLLLVTVDGRRPEWSVGMSLPELTDLLLALGAADAVNLDGGGSTTMVVRDVVRNRPSDDTGERANGDAVLLFARPLP